MGVEVFGECPRVRSAQDCQHCVGRLWLTDLLSPKAHSTAAVDREAVYVLDLQTLQKEPGI